MLKVSRDAKILNVTHNDCDGTGCSIVLSHVFKNLTIIDTSFYKIDEVLTSIQYKNYDYVIITDIHPKMSTLELSDKIILIDHHKSAIEYHNPSKNRFIIPDKGCAAVLVKHWVEKLYNIKLAQLDSLIYLINDYDLWTLNNVKSRMIADLQFHLYRPQKFFKEFCGGRTRLKTDELKWLRKRKNDLKEICSNLNVYNLDKIKGCYVEVTDFINDIADMLLTREKYNIVFIRNPNLKRTVSIRHNIEGLDIGGILKELNIGGGHSNAAAFNATSDDVMDKVILIENTIIERMKKI